ncbi:DNA-binding NarL/FixJ family response regulator [Mycolicibacterium sp. BK556]|uniref:response regulator transcription factor n=1 Tax=Mycobacteriaceae TaxID=1762 RepID=UPI0010E2EA01|nr:MULTISPECIES: response regulator transcription factor [Mycobacteriaceae]MBB3602197.1 DNA-binding NarL/FixJ family response regulator [Mycolicibacterium sp. BK556]MBB3631949.1 DNA-binding NarL/FixJ family response regulator [Mycolicibacterium sp. BK607]MBB3749968.1 DNA-binding NarL/FixJ family response regulator [Mycolicibacterium sp. BK634]TDO18760.1 DNA-binding NarL/FixJ family response regulator [Mycobacterium sp. BK086]
MSGIVGGKKIVVVIVDDHELFAQGLALLLTREWGEMFSVGGQTTYVEEAADLVASCDADVAIIDLTMPPLGGVAAIRHVKARRPATRILALSGTDDPSLAEEALRAGADGFLPKTARPEALAGPLWTVAEGLCVVDRTLLDALLTSNRKPPSTLLDSLSDQDLRLWTLLATGMETTDIAARMVVSERTAKRMVAGLLHKLGVTNRIAAAAMAGRYRLLDDLADTQGLS